MKSIIVFVLLFIVIFSFAAFGCSVSLWAHPYAKGIAWEWKYLFHNDGLIIAWANGVYLPLIVISIILSLCCFVYGEQIRVYKNTGV